MIRFTLCILSILSVSTTFAGWSNFVANYDKKDNPIGSHTWQVATYGNEWVYFANSNGLLQFNNRKWDLFPLKHSIELRSVRASIQDEVIYVGGINEFGYYKADDTGVLRYTCLSDSLAGNCMESKLGNIWNINQIDKVLYLQGDTKILKYIHGNHTLIDAKQRIYCSTEIRGVLYLGLEDGIYMLVGNRLLKRAPIDEHEVIRDILIVENEVVVITSEGLYKYDEYRTKLHRYTTPIDSLLKSNTLFCAAVSGSKIALGTIQGGVVLLDTKNLNAEFFNSSNGLQSDTILSLSFNDNMLWVGMDGGIDCLLLESHTTNLNSPNNPDGAGYTAIVKNEYLYLGTNIGLFYLRDPFSSDQSRQDGVHRFHNANGQVWRLAEVGGDIFSLQDAGVFTLRGSRAEHIEGIREAWSAISIPDYRGVKRTVIGTNNGLYIINKGKAGWTLDHKVEDFEGMCYQLYLDGDSSLWVYDSRYIHRVVLDKEFTSIVESKQYEIEDREEKWGIRATAMIDNEIYMLGLNNIYRYDSQSDALVISQKYANQEINLSTTTAMFAHNSSTAYLSNNELHIVDSSGNVGHCELLDDISIVRHSQGVVPISDSMMILTHEKGFALLNINKSLKNRDSRSVSLKNLYITSPKDSLIYASNYRNSQQDLQLPYSFNSLRFECSTNNIFHSDNLLYQYRMDGGEWSSATTWGIKEYSNIGVGEHTFQVRALFGNGEEALASYCFMILAPLYMSSWAYALYLLIMALSAYIFYRWLVRFIRRKKVQVALEKDREMDQQRQNFEIEKIEQELRHKSQELANLMVTSVNRNELFLHIKDEIKRCKGALDREPSEVIKRILIDIESHMDSNITSEETLKRIESEFDLIHDNFIKELEKRHPNLNYNEKMMCAYLKMGLSTKEIAPLLNISTRGVETVRYRIRKKFNLGRQDSLRGYLHSEI